MLVDRLLSKCGDNLSLLAAPATLDRVLDFAETSFDSLIDAMRASTPWIVLDLPHVWTGWTRRMLVAADEVDRDRRAGSRQSAQRQEPDRQREERPPQRLLRRGSSSTASACSKRPEIAAADFAKTVETGPIAVIPHDAKLFGAAANNGQMIAEIEPNGKIAEIFADLAATLAGRTEVRKPKRGVLEPLIAKLGRKRQ